MKVRETLGQDIAAGVAGWLQLQAVQRLQDLSGEDTVRGIVAQIVNAQGRYQPATSALPPSWGGGTKRRVDIALRARSAGSSTWYGAIEVKWVRGQFDVGLSRLAIVQDAMRLAFVKPSGDLATLLVLGGTRSALDELFDRTHPRAALKEAQRQCFGRLLSRDENNPSVSMPATDWRLHFPEAGARVPAMVFRAFDGKLVTKLVASMPATVGADEVGRVSVWHCKRTRGSVHEPAT